MIHAVPGGVFRSGLLSMITRRERKAIYDVADIADYIELRFGRERADPFNDDIDVEGEALGRDFRMYTGTGIYYRKKLILKKLFDPSIIFFFVDDARQTVFIIRVLRHERNWQKILWEGISYTFDWENCDDGHSQKIIKNNHRRAWQVYAAYCGKQFGKPVATVKGNSRTKVTITKINGKKINLKKNFKVYVTAYQLKDKSEADIAKTITGHVVGRKNTKYSNAKKIRVTVK